MRLGTMLLQLLIAFVLTATLLPLVLVTMPAARSPTAGPLLGVGMLVCLFAVIWLVWPRRST